MINLRLALLILVLANAGFFAWSQYVSSGRVQSAESNLLEQQINRDAIKLLTPQQVAALSAQPGAAPQPAACLEWGAFSTPDMAKAEEALVTLELGNRLSRRRVEEAAAWWVFLPPQPNRAGAQQKVAELKRLGVAEYFIVQQDSKFRFAVSLGVFRSEDAAKSYLAQLRTQGVKTAQVGPRDAQVQHVYFQVRDVSEDLRAKLVGLVQNFPGTDLKGCGGVSEPAKPAAVPAAPVPAGVSVAPTSKDAPKNAPKAAPKAGAALQGAARTA